MFYQAGLDPAQFIRAGQQAVRGPCWCGGHRRLLVWLDNLRYSCSDCGKRGYLAPRRLSVAEQAQLRHEAQETERRKQARIQQRISLFAREARWETYHQNLGPEQQAWWAQQGISSEWQDHFRLGYIPEKCFEHNGSFFYSSAYTIPIRAPGGEYVNLQYRLTNLANGAGKYRQESGLPAAAFIAWPLRPLEGPVILVEGAKKAIVLATQLENRPQVIGLPGSLSWGGILKMITKCRPVWIVLDPDAEQAARKLAKAVGGRARLVKLPVKPDDALLYFDALPQMRQAFVQARTI